MPDALHQRHTRAGSVMLELLISIAIFVGAAGFTLSAMRSALDGVRRADLRARAFDLAQTKLAQLDAGLLSVGDVQASGSSGGSLGGSSSASSSMDSSDTPTDLEVSIELTPSPTASSLLHARATVREIANGEIVSTVLTLDRFVRDDSGEGERTSP